MTSVGRMRRMALAIHRRVSSLSGSSASRYGPISSSAPSAAATDVASRRFCAPYCSAESVGCPFSPSVRSRITTRVPRARSAASTGPIVSSASPACAPTARIVRCGACAFATIAKMLEAMRPATYRRVLVVIQLPRGSERHSELNAVTVDGPDAELTHAQFVRRRRHHCVKPRTLG